MALRRTGNPTTEPVTLAEVKTHCRVDGSDDDALLTALITAAREMAEHETGRTLIDSEWTLTLDAFPEAIVLPMPRVTSITTVSYVDTTGATVLLSAAGYQLDNAGEQRNYLVPAYGYTWPDTLDQANAVTVVYRAGVADRTLVPAVAKQWMLLKIGQWNKDREAGTEKAITELPRAFFDGLLDPLRVMGV